jgi:hypothetical protein
VHLYQGTSEQFIADAVQARLANPTRDEKMICGELGDL